jgi:hypothetical protein
MEVTDEDGVMCIRSVECPPLFMTMLGTQCTSADAPVPFLSAIALKNLKYVCMLSGIK